MKLAINLIIASAIVLFIWAIIQAVLVYLDYRSLRREANRRLSAKIIVLHDKRVLEAKEVFS